MRIGYAATTLAALAVLTAGGLGAAVLSPHDPESQKPADQDDSSSLMSSNWSVETAPDFGVSWSEPNPNGVDGLRVRVDSAALRQQAFYQPYTMRTTRGSTVAGTATVGTGVLLEGEPLTATAIRVRMVHSPDGTCASGTFDRIGSALLTGGTDARRPVDTPPTGEPIDLDAATATTAGPPVTLCLELSVDPAVDAPDGQLTLAWPVSITRKN